MDFLGNPYKLWCSDRVKDKRIVLSFTFADKLSYDKNEGFRTADISQPFLLLEELKESNSEMVEGNGDTLNQFFEVLEEWEATLTVIFNVN
ncbi:MAG: hypothetical protein COB14_02815 [Alphaproteobacteria bacterium]|nr:MAG: hypothetical protein COB14_02815 [Alphaproteobacteria bacterium]